MKCLIAIFLIYTSSVMAQNEWPPHVGQPYPALSVLDADGSQISLEKFRGKILLIEPIGMSCPACQSFSGAEKRGGFGGVKPQAGLRSMHEHVRQYAGVDLSDERIEYIQLLLYDLSLKQPSAKDAALWRDHFGLAAHKNWHVFVAAKDMRGPASYNLIPGLQLVDKNFVLRFDATGHQPKHNLFTELLPELKKWLVQ